MNDAAMIIYEPKTGLCRFATYTGQSVLPKAKQETLLRILRENFPDPRIEELEEDVAVSEEACKGLECDLDVAEGRIKELEAEVAEAVDREEANR